MPGVYKEKECPYCGIKHRKRGQYCSASHAQLSRAPISKETKQKISETKKEQFADRTGDAYLDQADRARNAADHSHDRIKDPVPPRQPDDFSGEVIDGDVWFSDSDW